MTRPSLRGDEFDQRVTELWMAGISTLKIGVALGVTKNAVVGRAHRLGLPERGNAVAPLTQEKINAISALLEAGVRPKEICRRQHASRRTVRAIASGELTTAAPMRARDVPRPLMMGPTRGPCTPKRVPEDVGVRPIGVVHGRCCYPIGERDPKRWIGDRRVSFLECGESAVRGSYCAAHAALCYQRMTAAEAAA